MGTGCSAAAPDGGRGGTGTCTSTKPGDTTEVRTVAACDCVTALGGGGGAAIANVLSPESAASLGVGGFSVATGVGGGGATGGGGAANATCVGAAGATGAGAALFAGADCGAGAGVGAAAGVLLAV